MTFSGTEAAWRVILRDGVSRVSVRSCTREAHPSTGSLRHIFASQSDLLGFSMRLVIDRALHQLRDESNTAVLHACACTVMLRILSESGHLRADRERETRRPPLSSMGSVRTSLISRWTPIPVGRKPSLSYTWIRCSAALTETRRSLPSVTHRRHSTLRFTPTTAPNCGDFRPKRVRSVWALVYLQAGAPFHSRPLSL